jgi:predicted RNase H-like HicB family nuclease
MATIDPRSDDSQKIGDLDAWRPGAPYRCHLAILKEDDGTYSAIALNLPGAGSCGDTEEDAANNAKEAIAGVIESYQTRGVAIPWRDIAEYTIPEGAAQKWILVNV